MPYKRALQPGTDTDRANGVHVESKPNGLRNQPLEHPADGALAQQVRASGLHPEGRPFDPDRPHQNLPSPYYSHAGITIYHGLCEQILPQLGSFDGLLTDPPYGIKQDRGMGGCGYDGFGNGVKRQPREYAGGWDSERPDVGTFRLALSMADKAVIWGGNYFADMLPSTTKWLVWDKQQTMPSYSDAELAWTNLEGVSTKMFRFCGSGLMAEEKQRFHPTQKPLALMKWCIGKMGAVASLLDPYMGSGTSLVAAKALGIIATGIDSDERCCEIAAKRLSQEVFDFPVSALAGA